MERLRELENSTLEDPEDAEFDGEELPQDISNAHDDA